jgi:nitrogen regulatory protein PII-like uncharacterized protein
MSDETTSTTTQQAEPISTVDLIHFSGLSPERWRGLSDEQRDEWERVFRARGAPAGIAELAQGRRRK